MNCVGCLLRQKRICVGTLLLGIAVVVFLKKSLPEKQELSSDETLLEALTILERKSRDQVTRRTNPSEEDCPKEVWVVEDKGRFGNKFLEYVSARVVATFQNRDLYVTEEFYKFFLRYFTGLRAEVVDWKYLSAECNISTSMWKNISREYFVDNAHLLAPLENPYAKLTGYPLNITSVTWSVMFWHRKILLDEFRFHEAIMTHVNLRIKQVTKGLNYSTLVGIHVRRTDFHQHMIDLYGQAKTAGTDYFERAKAIYKQRYGNPVFMVISDDLAWCAKNLRAPDVVFPGQGDQDNPGWDLAFLASCDHLILTYGTFGVTAAYFSGGDVIIADNFTDKPNDLNERLKKSYLTDWTWLPV